MVGILNLKEKNMKKIKENVETRMAVHTHTLYCHLENKKVKLNISKNKGRTMSIKYVIGLSLFVFVEQIKHNHSRGGP